MPKLGSQYIDTPMPFSDVPPGVKFIYQHSLYQRCTQGLQPDDDVNKAIDMNTHQKIAFEDATEVLAWMPKSLLAQREKEKTPEWQRKYKEVQERAANEWSDCAEDVEVIPDGWKDREIRFIPAR